MRRTILIMLAVLALAAPTARADVADAEFYTSCDDGLLPGRTGPLGLPLTRCSMIGTASPDGSFEMEGLIQTPADGYAPGTGEFYAAASFPVVIDIPEATDQLTVVATVRIDQASAQNTTRLGGLAPKVHARSSLYLFGAASCSWCDVREFLFLSDTETGPDGTPPQTFTIQGTMQSLDPDEQIPAGPVTFILFAESYFWTEIGGVGSAAATLNGRVLSIAVAS